MKPLSLIVKSILLVFLCSVCSSAIAQKVNSTQEGSVWAPQIIKIDGKLGEWGTTLQAYNKTVKLWYTVANDDKYLYLAVRSDDLNYNAKILAGGISFTINTDDKKKDKGAYLLTFPIISRAGGGGGGRGGRRRGGFGGGGQDQDKPDTAAIIDQQRQSLATGKEISAIGFKEITDTLISIYNEYGIKAAATINDKGVYAAELAVPIAMLNIPADTKEIAYNIKVNGLQMQIKSITISDGGGGGGMAISGSGGGFGGGRFDGRGTPDGVDMMDATDFWAKYTIAVKTGK